MQSMLKQGGLGHVVLFVFAFETSGLAIIQTFNLDVMMVETPIIKHGNDAQNPLANIIAGKIL